MTDDEYAARLYCRILNIEEDNGDANTRHILDMINTLTDPERTVLECRIRHGKTLKQTGEYIGDLSPSRAREIEIKAILKLRHRSRVNGMSISKPFFGGHK